MKHAARFLLVALLFLTTGLFAQAAVEHSDQPAQAVKKVVKKASKKHHRHRAHKAQ